MKQRHVFILAGVVVVMAVLLSAICQPGLSPVPGPSSAPNTEGVEVPGISTDAPSSAIARPMESAVVRGFGPPDEWFVAGAISKTYADILAGVDLRTGTTSVYLGQSSPDGPYLPDYVVGRAYPGWDTSLLPGGVEVLSATLVLEFPAGGGRETAFDVVVYRGTWAPPIDLEDWLSRGSEVVGRWHLPASPIEGRSTVHTGQGITLFAPEPARKVRVPLDPGVVEAGGITRLELRHAREGSPPIAPEVVSLGRSQVTLEVKYRP